MDTTATHDFPKLVYPKGCPTQVPQAFDLSAAQQAIVIETCTGIDAGTRSRRKTASSSS